MSDGSRSEPCAIANDLAIAAKNAGAQAEAGPAAEQREDGVADTERRHTIAQASNRQAPNTPSSQPPSPNPSPSSAGAVFAAVAESSATGPP